MILNKTACGKSVSKRKAAIPVRLPGVRFESGRTVQQYPRPGAGVFCSGF
jgi:hypothetical protein